MRLMLFALAILLSSFSVLGAPAARQTVKAKAPKIYHRQGVVALLSYDTRFERNEEQATAARSVLNYALGYEWTPWISMLEYATYKPSTSSVGSLRVTRQEETVLAWAYWQPRDFNLLTPYLGAGLGGIRNTVETSVGGFVDQDRSPWNMAAGAALGLRLYPRKNFWLSTEGRMLKSSQLDPDPMLGIMLRAGVVF